MFSGLELRCEFIPENVERNGNVRRYGDDDGQQSGRRPSEKRKRSLCFFHGVQYDRISGAERL